MDASAGWLRIACSTTRAEMMGAPRDTQLARRILIIRTDRLGEVVLTVPLVAAIRERYPTADITWMVDPLLQELLTGMPAVTHWVPWRASSRAPWWWRAARLAAQLRAGTFDLVIIANAKKEFHVAAWAARIPVRIGYARKWGRLLTQRLPDRKARGDRHEVECNAELASCLGLVQGSPQWPLPSYDAEAARLSTLLAANATQALLTIHPWSSHPGKVWPAERYREVIDAARATLGAAIVLIGGPEHQAEARAFEPCPPGVINLVGRTSIRELAALLRQSRVLLSNDSGPVHLAAALGTRCVALFGTRNPSAGPVRWGPWGVGHEVIHRQSMADISVQETLAALQRAWGAGQ